MEDLKFKNLSEWKKLEEENNRLKRMYANLFLVHDAFKDAVAKNL